MAGDVRALASLQRDALLGEITEPRHLLCRALRRTGLLRRPPHPRRQPGTGRRSGALDAGDHRHDRSPPGGGRSSRERRHRDQALRRAQRRAGPPDHRRGPRAGPAGVGPCRAPAGSADRGGGGRCRRRLPCQPGGPGDGLGPARDGAARTGEPAARPRGCRPRYPVRHDGPTSRHLRADPAGLRRPRLRSSAWRAPSPAWRIGGA